MRTKKLTNLVLAVVCAAGFTTAKAETVVDKPTVMVTTIYQDGVTKDPNGNLLKLIDSKHRYIGVTVGCERTTYQFSGNCYITDGNGHYLTPELMYDKEVTTGIVRLKTFDLNKMTPEIESVDNQQNESQGTFFSTDNPSENLEWTVEDKGGYYTIYSPYKRAYLAVKGSDPRMYLTRDASDVYTQWQINPNGQIYQDRYNDFWYNETLYPAGTVINVPWGTLDGHEYFALHYKGDNSFETERHGNILDGNVLKTQIIPIRAAVFKTTVVGSFDIDKIIEAIKEKLASLGQYDNCPFAYNKSVVKVRYKDAYGNIQDTKDNDHTIPVCYDANDNIVDIYKDLCKGLLYVDMSGLEEVTNTNDESWKTFQDEVAANCLFFVPETYTSGCLGKNVVAKNGTGYIAKTNFELTDNTTDYDGDYINPFFSPYTFDTAEHAAIYKRNLDLSDDTKSSTILLPFGVRTLNKTGLSSYKVIFYNSEETQEDNNKLLAQTAEGGILSCWKSVNKTYEDGNGYVFTEANKPYHVRMQYNDVLSINIEEKGTTVEATEIKEYDNNMGDWTAYSNYFGMLHPKSQTNGTQYYYYYNGMYLNSSFISWDYFYSDPYRAYFTSNVNNGKGDGKSYKIFFDGFDEPESATEIESATADETATTEVIYTLSGVKVNGKPQQHGIYIVNGKKKMF